MTDAFSVDPSALADAIERMAEYMRHSESIMTEIDSLVTHLHHTWSGEAAAAHVEAHRHWSHGEATMQAALHQLKAAGGAAQYNYTQAMATNSAMWS